MGQDLPGLNGVPGFHLGLVVGCCLPGMRVVVEELVLLHAIPVLDLDGVRGDGQDLAGATGTDDPQLGTDLPVQGRAVREPGLDERGFPALNGQRLDVDLRSHEEPLTLHAFRHRDQGGRGAPHTGDVGQLVGDVFTPHVPDPVAPEGPDP